MCGLFPWNVNMPVRTSSQSPNKMPFWTFFLDETSIQIIALDQITALLLPVICWKHCLLMGMDGISHHTYHFASSSTSICSLTAWKVSFSGLWWRLDGSACHSVTEWVRTLLVFYAVLQNHMLFDLSSMAKRPAGKAVLRVYMWVSGGRAVFFMPCIQRQRVWEDDSGGGCLSLAGLQCGNSLCISLWSESFQHINITLPHKET